MPPQSQRPSGELNQMQQVFEDLARQFGMSPEDVKRALETLDQNTGRYPEPKHFLGPGTPQGPRPGSPSPLYTPRGMGGMFADVARETPGTAPMLGTGNIQTMLEDPRPLVPTMGLLGAVRDKIGDAFTSVLPQQFVEGARMIPFTPNSPYRVARQPTRNFGETHIGPATLAPGSDMHWSQWPEGLRRQYRHPNDPEFGSPNGPAYQRDPAQEMVDQLERASQDLDKRLYPNRNVNTDDIIKGMRSPIFDKAAQDFREAGAKAKTESAAPPSFDPAQFETALQRVEKRMAEAGFKIKRVSSGRSAEEQNKHYQKGRSAPGPIVTDADGYVKKSRHQEGGAVDYWFVGKDGKVNADESNPWDLLGQISKEEGLDWGGDWKGGPGQVGRDRPHVQYRKTEVRPAKPATLADNLPQMPGAPQTRPGYASDGRPIARPRTGLLGAAAGAVSEGENGLDELAVLRDAIWNEVVGLSKPRPGATPPPAATPQAAVAQLAAQNMGVPTSPSRGALLERPQNFDPPPMPTPPAPEPDRRVLLGRNQQPSFGGASLPDAPQNFDLPPVPEAKPSEQLLGKNQLPSFDPNAPTESKMSAGAADFTPPEDEESAPLKPSTAPPAVQQMAAQIEKHDQPNKPAWKQVLSSIMTNLPDALIAYTSARYNRPDIADNWLKQKMAHMEAVNEAAKRDIERTKNEQERADKEFDHEQTLAGRRVTIAQQMAALNEKVAKGELLDLDDYIHQLTFWGGFYESVGGSYKDVVKAFPIPVLDRINVLRKQMFEWGEKNDWDKALWDTKPFQHPLTGKPMSVREAAHTLGLFDPVTGEPMLNLGKLSQVAYTDEAGNDVIEMKNQADMARSGQKLKQSPTRASHIATTPDGKVIVVPTVDGIPGQAIDVEGGAPDTTNAAKFSEMADTGMKLDQFEAIKAVLKQRAARRGNKNYIPSGRDVQGFFASQDPDDLADLDVMLKAIAGMKAEPPPERPKTFPWWASKKQ